MITFRMEDKAVQTALNRLQSSVSNISPAMNSVGTTLVDNIRMGFKDSRDPWGHKWQSLSQSAIMGRLGHRKDSFGKKGKISAKGRSYLTGGIQPLLDTGALRSSITYNASKTGLVVGTNIKYARTHQFGAKQGAFGRTKRGGPLPFGNIPARPFMPIRNNRVDLPANWQKEIIGLIAAHITGAVNAER